MDPRGCVRGATESAENASPRSTESGTGVPSRSSKRPFEHLDLNRPPSLCYGPAVFILREKQVLKARLISSDSATDRCILEAQNGQLRPVPGIKSFGELEVGERVYTVGAPRGLENTLGDGIVSGLRKVGRIALEGAMRRFAASLELLEDDVFARDIHDGRVFSLSQIQSTRRVRKDFPVSRDSNAHGTFVDLDSVLRIFRVGS